MASRDRFIIMIKKHMHTLHRKIGIPYQETTLNQVPLECLFYMVPMISQGHQHHSILAQLQSSNLEKNWPMMTGLSTLNF